MDSSELPMSVEETLTAEDTVEERLSRRRAVNRQRERHAALRRPLRRERLDCPDAVHSTSEDQGKGAPLKQLRKERLDCFDNELSINKERTTCMLVEAHDSFNTLAALAP